MSQTKQAGGEAAAFSSVPLILMAKAPRPGHVKTRLTPPLSPEQACHLYRCFLKDLGRRLATTNISVRLYHAPSSAGPELQELLDLPCSLHPQQGQGLGARMEAAFSETLRASPAALMIGTDLPDLPLEYLERAVSALESGTEGVLGPDRDGGYFLIGMRTAVPGIFDLPMSNASLASRTRAALREAGLEFEELPPWRDVDDIGDLRALNARLELRADRDSWATWRALQQLECVSSHSGQRPEVQ